MFQLSVKNVQRSSNKSRISMISFILRVFFLFLCPVLTGLIFIFHIGFMVSLVAYIENEMQDNNSSKNKKKNVSLDDCTESLIKLILFNSMRENP